MQKAILILLFTLFSGSMYAQTSSPNTSPKQEISINGFRNPSVGAEYRYGDVSVHAGYYPTAFKAGENTSFFKAGVSFWFLPVDEKEQPSSFYAGASYLRGFNRAYDGKNALGVETGFRWTIWKGLNLRIGAIVVTAKGESLKVNPTPGISYSLFL